MGDLLNFRIVDFIDILLVAFIMYQIYTLVKGTSAFNIIIGIFAIYMLWVVVKMLHMELLSMILGQVIGVGVIALIVVFQQEIRRFLLYIGTRYFSSHMRNSLISGSGESYIDEVLTACENMSASRTGALIVFARRGNLSLVEQSGDIISGRISQRLIENIFYKNSPMHDGAMLIVNRTIQAARCVLPASERTDIPANYGMRHRAAIGLTEQTDAVVVVVSEQTGKISYIENGVLFPDQSVLSLKDKLITALSQ